MRRGLGRGYGKGYRNIISRDPIIHSQSARGIKQPQKIPNLHNKTAIILSPKKTYKSIKCCYKSCPNEAHGYYSGYGYGLWLCKQHAGESQEPKTLVSDIKRNPKHKSRWQLKENFRNGKFVSKRELETEKLGHNRAFWKHLEDDLKSFDYTYPFSDDFGVWKSGENEEKRISKIIKIAYAKNPTKTKTLVKKYKQKYGVQFSLKK